MHEHTRIRRAAQRASAANVDLNDAPVLALEAFDLGAALIDLTHRRIVWCSAGFSSRCCVQIGDRVELLAQALPGLDDVLTRLARAPQALLSSQGDGLAPLQYLTVVGESGPMAVEACRAQPGLAAVRLKPDTSRHVDANDQEQAARRHLEDREKLLFTSRTLAVGEMASTLAHELNQPIGTVSNVLRGMRARLTQAQATASFDALADDLKSALQLALDQAQFASRIITRIREYTQSRQPRRDVLDLGQVVRESLSLLDWEVQRDAVQVSLHLPRESLLVQADEVMLEQVFVNLMRNALDAMRHSGAPARRLCLGLGTERGMAVLTVRDNGPGLPADAPVFVPFQSTKPNGMGIGLNICRSFVELHQGRLWFTPNDVLPTAPGQDLDDSRGCTFHVALPLHVAERATTTTNTTAAIGPHELARSSA
jgi:two-component system, LuxR family, sensor kinase FixL